MNARVSRLFEAFRRSADKDAIIFRGAAMTFGRLDLLARRYARSLADLGISRGDRVAVFAESAPETVVALLGHYRLGVIHVPVNSRYRGEEARHVLEDSGSSAVVFGPSCRETLDAVGTDAGFRRIALAETAHDDDVSFGSLVADSVSPLDGEPVPEDADTALLVYTSGTTGKSKGAELSFRAVVDNIEALTDLWRFSSDDRVVVALPLFHVHGLCLGIHGALLHGATVLLHERFDAERVVESFETHGATVFMGVPTMYVRLLEHLARNPRAAGSLSLARLFIAGSAALSPEDFKAFRAVTGHAILERYGMTETLFTLSNPYGEERRPGTVGLPVRGCDVRIVDESGADVSGGELGEVLVKSNGMMSGYWNRPAETGASFRDGWFLTGDVARRDADGYVTIAGRKSVDLIKSGGFKISAREIEDVLRRHPAVKDVAVVGLPDATWGERIEAVVELKPGSESGGRGALCADLIAFASGLLADYKKPRAVHIVQELPRNVLGKVQKHLLVRRLAG